MTSRFAKLLVPLDFTAKNEIALATAHELARQYQSSVTLLHVIEPVEYAEDAEIRAFSAMLESKAQSRLHAAAQAFRDDQVDVVEEVLLGRRGPEIIRYVLDQEIDLVVLSSHPIDPARPEASFAAFSHQISVLCPCPVLLVK